MSRIGDALPDPPPDGQPIRCQWHAVTTTGPAAEWPQDRFHRSVHAIGYDCPSWADHYAIHTCPAELADDCPWPHPVFLICWNHATYSLPSGFRSEWKGLHGVHANYLHDSILGREDWLRWMEAYRARSERRPLPTAADVDDEQRTMTTTLF